MTREERIMRDFNAVREDIRENIGLAHEWAINALRDHEGSGHAIYVTSNRKTGGVVCSFAKSSWSGDHCSRPMDHGAEAIVMAVCEYFNGA